MLRRVKPVLLLLILWLAAFPPSLLHADEFRLLPSVAEKFEYNDNIYVAPSNTTPIEDT